MPVAWISFALGPIRSSSTDAALTFCCVTGTWSVSTLPSAFLPSFHCSLKNSGGGGVAGRSRAAAPAGGAAAGVCAHAPAQNRTLDAIETTTVDMRDTTLSFESGEPVLSTPSRTRTLSRRGCPTEHQRPQHGEVEREA